MSRASGSAAAVVIASFTWAVAVGGESVVDRFQSMLDGGVELQGRAVGGKCHAHVVRLEAQARTAERQELAAHHAAEAGPAHAGEDQGHAEVDLETRPVLWDGGRERQPDRNLRHGLQDLGQALDEHVGPAAAIAGEPAQGDAEHEAQEDADQAQEEGDAAAVEHAAEEILPQTVCAQEKAGRLLAADAEEMAVRRDEPQELPRLAVDPERERLAAAGVDPVVALQGHGVLFLFLYP